MTSSNIVHQPCGLPLKPLPTVSTTFPTIVTATSDDLPGYFETEQLETTRIPEGWDIHFDIITQLQAEKYWEDVGRLIFAGVRLSSAGAKFATKWNGLVEECFEDLGSITKERSRVVEMKVKSLRIVAEWNEKIAGLRREVEKERVLFVELANADSLDLKVKACFAAHENLGRDGDGERWWEETVGRLLKYSEQWMSVPFTLETWLVELTGPTNREKREEEEQPEEIRIYADTLCASFEQAEGMKSRRELVYLIKDGEMTKKGLMAWVSVELGHVTGV